jgi:hypothetical protein
MRTRTAEAFGAQTRKLADVLLANRVAPREVVALGAASKAYIKDLLVTGQRTRLGQKDADKLPMPYII